MNELISHSTQTYVAKELNKIIGKKEENHKKITRQSVHGWANGHLPRPMVQDAIMCLYIRERGRGRLNELWKKYINKIDEEGNKCHS
ncbi:MAG: hypothetical protein ACYCSQ_04920 [bacterium]